MIRTDPRLEHIPVVMVTARRRATTAQADQTPVDAFLAKPFEPDELIAWWVSGLGRPALSGW